MHPCITEVSQQMFAGRAVQGCGRDRVQDASIGEFPREEQLEALEENHCCAEQIEENKRFSQSQTKLYPEHLKQEIHSSIETNEILYTIKSRRIATSQGNNTPERQV